MTNCDDFHGYQSMQLGFINISFWLGRLWNLTVYDIDVKLFQIHCV